MSARYMLDTNICIHLRMRRPTAVHERFRMLGTEEAVMSAVTYGELRFGALKSPHRDRDVPLLDAMTSFVPVQPLTASAAEAYADIRLFLGSRGELIGPNDLWIAAHARAAGLTLITNNEREFRRVPGLQVENWAAT